MPSATDAPELADRRNSLGGLSSRTRAVVGLAIVVACCALMALAARRAGPSVGGPLGPVRQPATIEASHPLPDDADRDGVPDPRENQVALRFAPVVVHDRAEAVYPTSVDDFLERTSLWFYDDACTPDLVVPFGPASQAALFTASAPTCGADDPIDSFGVRSRRKQRTFFLADVALEHRRGSDSPDRWPMYAHVYRNDWDGLTVQYWRLYPYNDRFPYHGGDWEGFHLVLGPRDSVLELALIGHTDIVVQSPSAFAWDSGDGGLHPVVGVAQGGHTTTQLAPPDGRRHESWRDPVVNLGEKTRPLNGQVFVRFSGLWGTPGSFYQSSGYWGPAFNETDLADDGFVTAWCRGMLHPERQIDGTRECYPDRESR